MTEIISPNNEKGKIAVTAEAAAKYRTGQARLRQRFVEQCLKVHNVGDLDELRRELRDCRNSYVRARRFYEAKRGVNLGHRLETQLNKLRSGSIDLVEGIVFPDSRMTVQILTKPIICTDPQTKRRYLLGRFKIEIDFDCDPYDDGAENLVTFTNLDREVDGYYAPHIDSGGGLCFGNIEEHLTEYIAAVQLEAAVTMCLAFLQTRNPDDSSGNCLEKFPRYKPTRRTKRKPTRKVAKRTRKR